MTPLVDYAFNLNRSVQNLFSAIVYLPFKRVNNEIEEDQGDLFIEFLG